MRGSIRSKMTRSGSLSAFPPGESVARDVDLEALMLEFELQDAVDGGVVSTTRMRGSWPVSPC